MIVRDRMMRCKRDRAMHSGNDGIKSAAGIDDMRMKNIGYGVISILLALTFITAGVFGTVIPAQAE